MNLSKLALVALGALVVAASSAKAGGDAIAVPAPIPVQEGFTWYFRADLNYGWPRERGFAERGLVYGEDASRSFTSSAIPFTSHEDDAFGGSVGIGAYLTPHIRGDITFDWRHDQANRFTGSYAYFYAPLPPDTVKGSVLDSLKLSSAVGLVNGYFEPLPRGMFTPYVGAGIGFVYNQITRAYLDSETLVDGGGAAVATRSRLAAGKDNDVAFAAALMAGLSFSLDQRWMLDVGYRALFLDGMSSTVDAHSFVNIVIPTQHSVATLGETWEHQVRIGVRFNMW